MMNIVEFKNVNKKIENRQIIDAFNLSIQEGEVFGILGPNGAGKTTLIKLMLGLLKMDSGEILINGISSQKNHQKAVERVGALVEAPVYYPYLSGLDNLKVFSMMAKEKKNIQDIIKVIGLEEQIEKKVSAYSLGMKQRLGLGIALIRNPRILVLDEPTNGLDPAGIAELRNYLRHIAQENNITVIVSSHILSEMNLLCDRFAIISKGKMVKTIEKDDFLTQNGIQRYTIQVNDVLAGYAILTKICDAKIDEQVITCNASKEEISNIVKVLVEKGIKIYAVQTAGNPLESLYFKAINTTKGV